MRCIVCVGISASGKTTWAEQFCRNRNDWVNINRDEIRFHGGTPDWYNYKFKKSKEDIVTKTASKMISMACKAEKNIIISDTNLNVKRREALIETLETYGYEVEVKLFEVTLKEAIARDKQREGGVGEEVIYRQWLDMYRTPVTRESGELAYLFDVDGTVATNNSGRGWYDWDRVGEDSPIDHVMSVAKSLNTAGYTIIFFSARDKVCYDITKEWLVEHFGSSDFELFMRDKGSMMRDSEMKEKMYFEYVHDFYNVQGVFDDRPQVTKECWLKLGIPVFAVGNPYKSF